MTAEPTMRQPVTPDTAPPAPTSGDLTRTLVGLKLRLVRNGLKRSVWKLVGLILGALYALGLVAMGIAGLIALRFAPVVEAAAATTLIFSLVTLGWMLFPLLLFGVDETLDPRRFALLPVRARELLPGFVLASLVGIPGVGTVVFSLGLLGTWSRGVVTVLATCASIVLGVFLCVLWARALLTWLAALLAGRRSRDLTVVMFMVIVMGFSLGAQGVSLLTSRSDPAALLASLRQVGTIAGWTPLGWVWAIPGAVAQGHWAAAGVRLVLSLALAAGLAWLWRVRLDIALVTPAETGGDGRTVRSGIGRYLPTSPAGAVATRCLIYWRRDPRYLVGAVAMVMLPVILAAGAMINSNGSPLILLAPLAVTMLGGSSIVSDVAYDNNALSLHVLTGTRGADDRLGRLITYLVIMIPLSLLTLGILMAVSDQWQYLPAVGALMIVTLLGGLGAGLWVGVYVPGKAPAPGANALSASSNGSLMAMVGLLASSVGMLLVSLPTAAFIVAGLVTDQNWLTLVALPVAVVSGVLACWAGVRFGGRALDRRWPELLELVSS